MDSYTDLSKESELNGLLIKSACGISCGYQYEVKYDHEYVTQEPGIESHATTMSLQPSHTTLNSDVCDETEYEEETVIEYISVDIHDQEILSRDNPLEDVEIYVRTRQLCPPH
jgi:hypothetical protein